jgi:transposase InsO family protein
LKHGDLQRYAEGIGTSPHTLRRWEREVEEAQGPPPGRPRTSEEVRRRARELVREVVEEQGWSVGEGPVYRALGCDVPRRLVREVLAELKRAHRRRKRTIAERERTSIHVQARDALWSQDATHLCRDEKKTAVQAEVIREVASTRTIEIAVGPAATGADVIAALERTRVERGTLPLVWATDNGSPYVSKKVARYLAKRQVVHLRSLPHTPQHNAWSEHGMRELKQEAALEGSCNPRELRNRMRVAQKRLDHHRLRRTRNWMTAVQADAAVTSATALVDRARFYKQARSAIRKAVLNSCSLRERRRATREAVLQTMERFQLIKRTRGGVPLTSANSYRVS